jgi:hypothetical protein
VDVLLDSIEELGRAARFQRGLLGRRHADPV